MDFQQLQTFCTVAKTKSFTKASEQLDYAQSSISSQIRMLEEDLQVKLFERIGRRVFLTPAGDVMLIYAQRLLKLAEEAKDVVGGSDVPKGKLTIGAPESISIYRLPIILQQYREVYPEVELVLKLGSCQDILGWLRNNTVDIGLLMDNETADADLMVEALRKESMALVAGPKHPLAKKKEGVQPEDMRDTQLILIEKEGCYRCIFEAQLAQANIHPSSTLEIGSIETIKKCVISGLGISLLPYMSVEQELSSGTLCELRWKGKDFGVSTLMIHHKDKWLSPAIKAFMSLTRDRLQCKSTDKKRRP